jgi:hypothetical protein
MKRITASLIAAALAIVPTMAQQAEVGKPAPAFTLPGASGKTHSLSDFKGKYVILEWTNHDCPFVKKFYDQGDMPKLQKAAMEKGDVVWIQVLSSAPGKQGHADAAGVMEIRSKTGTASVDTLLDPDGKVGTLYGAKTTPHMYIIDKEGILIYNGAIDDKKSPKQSDIEGSKNYVMLALEEAKAGKPISNPTTAPYGCSVKYQK